jgi:hypothetical protein
MGVFADLKFDSEVQAGERVCFDARRSFVTPGRSLASVEITPSYSGAAIPVWDGSAGDKYLDWAYEFGFEVGASKNAVNLFVGGVAKLATVANGVYGTEAAFAAAVASALNALVGCGTFTVALDARKRATISNDSFSFRLIPSGAGSVLPELGFSSDQESESTETTGEPVAYCTQLVTAEATDDLAVTAANAKMIKIFSEFGDHLFSTDDDLTKHEPEIFNLLPSSHSSFNAYHRRAQGLILAWLDKEGYTDAFGAKFTKWSIRDVSEVREWAAMMTLRLVFEGVSNAIDDVFARKAATYLALETMYRERAILRIDTDGDGSAEPATGEGVDIRSARVYRR